MLHEINAIRAGAHLPLGRLITRDDRLVLAAAAADRDPVLPPLKSAGSEFGLWGIEPAATVRGTPDPSGVVRAWVYDDGWQGSHTINYDCTSPSAPACNGHRRAVLSARPFKGAKLQIDVGVRSAYLGSFNASSVAVLMIWTA